MKTFYFSDYQSPIGSIRLVASDQALHGAWFHGSRHYLSNFKEEQLVDQSNSILECASEWLTAFFMADIEGFTQIEIPVKPIGTDFQQCVWHQLITIPYGQTRSYKQVAQQVAEALNRPSMSSQAVGGAIGRNPISLFIPCHRVIATDGSLTGYAGGLDKKAYLLNLETSHPLIHK